MNAAAIKSEFIDWKRLRDLLFQFYPTSFFNRGGLSKSGHFCKR